MNHINADGFRFQIMDIRRGTTVDGPGFRTSIYFAGCNHHCQGCHNPESWDPSAGTETSMEEILNVVEEEDFDVTFTGGDPLMNPEPVGALASEIKKRYGKNIWMFTGYTAEEIMASEQLRNAIKQVDTIVEGKFIKVLRDPDLPFRGSSNQRIIDTKDLLG